MEMEMEMSTPSKNQIAPTSVSQFENSPVFDYINNLSPIDLVKSVHTDQTFNLPSFTSPLSVFTSPQLSCQRDSTSFIRRSQFSDTSKPELPQSKDDNYKREGIQEAAKLSDLHAEQFGCFTSGSSARVVMTEPLSEHLDLLIELPNALKFVRGSPDGNMLPHAAIKIDSESEMVGNSNERLCSYESKKDLHKICRIKQNKDEAGCDWVTLISDVADILNFDSSMVEEQAEEQKMVDPGTVSFIANVLQMPQDNTNDMENVESIGCIGASKQNETQEQGIRSIEFEEHEEANQIPSNLSGTLPNQLAVNDAVAKVDVKGKKCSQSTCKQHKIRRRCLVFEMAGAHKKKSVCDSNSGSSISSQSDCEGACVEKHLTPRKTRMSTTLSMLSGRGIGLHLNALATSSRDGNVIKIETLASEKQEIKTDLVPCDNKDKVTENAPYTSMIVSDNFGSSSPKTKRHKLEHVGVVCKRCNCKRSKCLKLYCECFAAGLYCIEPCSCQDCLNKPAHEVTVLETRKQIESRNPLAFAPKVIRSMDSVSEFGDESNKTPSSARHKRGCNCKKSSCLKKYCECFQGGVGCSSSCRCDRCKNTFGSKNDLIGVEENELEGEEVEAHEKNASDASLHDAIIKEGEEQHPDLPIPSETARSPIQQPISFSRPLSGSYLPGIGPSSQMCTSQNFGADFGSHQPKFEMHLPVIPEDETPEILTTSCSPTSGVKSASPNCKRVSPPHHGFGSSATWRGRKLILRSVPLFPSFNSPCEP